jgi:hypothetical protein
MRTPLLLAREAMEAAVQALPPTKGDSDAAAALGGDTTHTALRGASSIGQHEIEHSERASISGSARAGAGTGQGLSFGAAPSVSAAC